MDTKVKETINELKDFNSFYVKQMVNFLFQNEMYFFNVKEENLSINRNFILQIIEEAEVNKRGGDRNFVEWFDNFYLDFWNNKENPYNTNLELFSNSFELLPNFRIENYKFNLDNVNDYSVIISKKDFWKLFDLDDVYKDLIDFKNILLSPIVKNKAQELLCAFEDKQKNRNYFFKRKDFLNENYFHNKLFHYHHYKLTYFNEDFDSTHKWIKEKSMDSFFEKYSQHREYENILQYYLSQDIFEEFLYCDYY